MSAPPPDSSAPPCSSPQRETGDAPHERHALAVVLSSEASAETAEALARKLLERRLVACVSLLPVRSLYRWQGRLESTEEVKLLLKTSPALLGRLHQALQQLHSYQTPEWIVLQGRGDNGYGGWLQGELDLEASLELNPDGSSPAREGTPWDEAPAG